MNLEKEIKRCERYDLISFDIFDTLIERDVLNPTDIFNLVGKEVMQSDKEAELFKEMRIKAEIEARKESVNGEVTLNDIYKQLFAHYGGKTGLLKECEIKTELGHCHAKVQYKRLLLSCVQRNCRVVLISDMYLTSKEIEAMLDKCGIGGYSDLFVSNAYDCDKVSGRLFLEAERTMGIESCRHLHYGDSIKADYLGAKKAGATPRLVLKNNFIKRVLKRWL